MARISILETVDYFIMKVHLYTLTVHCELSDMYYTEREAYNTRIYPEHVQRKPQFVFQTRFWPRPAPMRALLGLAITQASIFMTRLGRDTLNAEQVLELFDTGTYSILDWMSSQEYSPNEVLDREDIHRIGTDAVRVIRCLVEQGRGFIYSISILNDD